MFTFAKPTYVQRVFTPKKRTNQNDFKKYRLPLFVKIFKRINRSNFREINFILPPMKCEHLVDAFLWFLLNAKSLIKSCLKGMKIR